MSRSDQRAHDRRLLYRRRIDPPRAPYILGLELHRALLFSVVFTGIALAIFGAVKGRLTGINMVKSAFQTMLVGGLAAGAAFYLASLFGQQ